MNETIKLFIIDKDLRIREQGNFKVGDADKISIKSGGTENWNPLIGETTFVEKKGWKKYLIWGERNWKREYYILRKGEKCIDFASGDVPTPNPNKLKQANMVLIAKEVGKDTEQKTPAILYALFIFSLIQFIILLQSMGAFR